MAAPNNNTVLISGAGIAGPTLAYWLLQYGFEPTLIEIAPAPREGGYMIDFWGVGYDVAERMGLIPTLQGLGYDMTEVRMVDGRGRKIGGFGAHSFRAAAGGRYFSILRSDVARQIYRLIDGKAETIFGDSVRSIDQDETGVRVTFKNAQTRQFNLVIGADGLHSAVRHSVFGPEERFEKYLGYYVASFEVADYPHRDDGVYVGYTTPRRQIARYALRGNRTVFLFIWVEESKLAIDHHDVDGQKKLLRDRFGDGGWENGAILDALGTSDNLYFDAVSQIHIDKWSRGRAALVGDAAYCPSFLAGEGSAFAMGGAYLLAGELMRAEGDYAAAFRNYEQKFHPFVKGKQQAARRLGSWFAPKTELGLIVRNQITRLMAMPWIGDWLFSRMVGDRFTLPDYRP